MAARHPEPLEQNILRRQQCLPWFPYNHLMCLRGGGVAVACPYDCTKGRVPKLKSAKVWSLTPLPNNNYGLFTQNVFD